MAFNVWFTKPSSTWPLALAPCVGDHCLCLAHPMSFRWSDDPKRTMELDGYGHRSKPFKTLVPCFSYWFLAYGSSSPISMVLIYFEPKSIKSGIRPHLQIQMQKSNGVFTWFSVKYVKSRFFHARTTTIIWISPPNQPSASPSVRPSVRPPVAGRAHAVPLGVLATPSSCLGALGLGGFGSTSGECSKTHLRKRKN